MTGREGQDLYRPLLEHVEREGRVAGIGALHAMDAAVGGRRRGDRRRPRPAGGPAGRPRRRRRGYGPRPVTPGAPVVSNGTESAVAPVAENGAAAPPRKFRRRRSRRRGGFAATNGTQGTSPDGGTPVAEPAATPQPEAAAQVAERSG